jgi:hypothetical protein
MKKIFVLLTFISLMACNQEPKWSARCYVRFFEEDNKMQSKIEVHGLAEKKAAAIQLDEVRFNEGAMEHRDNNVIGHYYQADNFSGFPKSGFEFQLQQGKEKATVQFDTSPFEGYAIKETSISKSKSFALTWNGKALGKEETLTITITDVEGTVAQAVVNGATAAAEARIPSQMYAKLKEGKGTFFLVKTSLPIARTKNINAQAEVGYYTKTMEVEIIE